MPGPEVLIGKCDKRIMGEVITRMVQDKSITDCSDKFVIPSGGEIRLGVPDVKDVIEGKPAAILGLFSINEFPPFYDILIVFQQTEVIPFATDDEKRLHKGCFSHYDLATRTSVGATVLTVGKDHPGIVIPIEPTGRFCLAITIAHPILTRNFLQVRETMRWGTGTDGNEK